VVVAPTNGSRVQQRRANQKFAQSAKVHTGISRANTNSGRGNCDLSKSLAETFSPSKWSRQPDLNQRLRGTSSASWATRRCRGLRCGWGKRLSKRLPPPALQKLLFLLRVSDSSPLAWIGLPKSFFLKGLRQQVTTITTAEIASLLAKGWERSLDEAERQILQYKRKIFELRNSIKIIQEKIASGEPWPTATREQHS
jgi:hypothetical protein